MQQKGWRSYIEEFRDSKAEDGFSTVSSSTSIVESRDKSFVLDLKLLFYYSKLFFGKVSFQIFYCETNLFH